jgi:hypothetical protein
MTAEKLLGRLQGVRGAGPGRWMARCPAHEDRTASLSIREVEDGKVLVKDFGGCDVSAVLGAVGLTFSDLFPRRVGDYRPAERHPFSPLQVLRAIGHEALTVAFIAQDFAAGGSLTNETTQRLQVASNRVLSAMSAVGDDDVLREIRNRKRDPGTYQ